MIKKEALAAVKKIKEMVTCEEMFSTGNMYIDFITENVSWAGAKTKEAHEQPTTPVC